MKTIEAAYRDHGHSLTSVRHQSGLIPASLLIRLGTPIAAISTAAVIGLLWTWSVENEAWLYVSAALVGLAAIIATLRWKVGVVLLLLYLPLEGLVTNIFYNSLAPLLFKDVLVGAVYLGVIRGHDLSGVLAAVPVSIKTALWALVALCLVESFNPNLAGPAVALVGFRVLLLYIPLLFVGIAFARDRGSLHGLSALVVYTSAPIVGFGIWEWIAGPDFAYSLGPGFARSIWILGGEATNSLIYRPASTFSFVGQFSDYLFCVSLLAFALLHTPMTRLRWLVTLLIFLEICVADVVAAGRTVWFILPIAFLAFYVVIRSPYFVRVLPLMIGALIVAALVGTSTLANRIPALVENPDYFWDRAGHNFTFFVDLLGSGWTAAVGNGTGSALAATRLVNGGIVPISFEGGWGIPLYMFGLIGVGAYALLYAIVARQVWSGACQWEKPLRAIPVIVFVYFVIQVMLDGAVNYPPANIYVWLFTGLVAGPAIRSVIARSGPSVHLRPAQTTLNLGAGDANQMFA